MKSKRRIITGQRLAIIFIIVAIVTATLVSISFIKIFGKAKENTISEASYIEELFASNLPEVKEICEKKEWGNDIIGSATREEIPIPKGYEYKKGDLSTGIIVRETETGSELLWIPYQEDASSNVDEYYKNVNELELDSDAIKSIDKYNGFYVYLNMNVGINDLKDISNDKYQNYAKQLNSMGKYKDTHIVSKDEIAQILTYTSKNKINLETGVEAMTIGLYSTLNIANEDDKVSSNVVATKASYGTFDRTNVGVQVASNKTKDNDDEPSYAYVTVKAANKNETEVPIPSGFEYCVNDGIVTIRQKSNKNMVYIWVPVKSDDENTKNIEVLKNAKKELQDMYINYVSSGDDDVQDPTKKGSDLYKSFNYTEDDFSEDFKKSINTYGGFYVSEAELGTDSEGNSYNKARGMINYSASERLGGGDYYRASNQNFNDQNIKKLISESCKEESVVGHLMYGAEYDMIMCWINKTNKADNYNLLIKDSTLVGKYSNSNIGANASKEASSKYFNGIWGLAGNLFERTAERYKEDNNVELVLRGGSYKNKGNEYPMVSRSFIDSMDTARKDEDIYDKGSAIGIRSCLYIQNGISKKRKVSEDDEYDNKISESDNNISFKKLSSEVSRYVKNWDGLKIYESADDTKEPISTEGFATRIVVTEKAEEFSAPGLFWGKGKVEGKGNEVYFNCMDLCELRNENTVNNVEFIIGEEVKRYYDDKIEAYEKPDLNSNHVTLNSEIIIICGKSTNMEWAKVINENKVYYVQSQNLRLSAEKNIDGISFLIWDWTEPRYIKVWDSVKIYEKPNESSNVIMELTESDAVWVSAKAKDATNSDLQWARVELQDNKKGYINANCLTKGDEIDGVVFAKAKESTKRWYSGLTLYKSPKDDAEKTKVEYSGEIEVLGKSADGNWAMVSTGEVLYVKVNELLGVPFVYRDAVKKYYHSDLTLYDNVPNGSTSKLQGHGEVTVIGVSVMDWNYSVIENDGYKYVKTSDLKDTAYVEPKQNTDNNNNSGNEDNYEKNKDVVNGIEFTAYSKTRYANNWREIKIYEKPSSSSKILATYDMADEVKVTAKSTNGRWARVKKGNYTGYVLTSGLSEGEKVGDKIIISATARTRYIDESTAVYDKPGGKKVLTTSSIQDIPTKECGKSTDKKWSRIIEGGKYRYVLSEKLHNVQKKKFEIKSLKGIKINGVEMLFTRTENGEINMNNLNMEKLDTEKYNVEVTYEE